MPAYDTVLDALNGLKQRGYTLDFNLAFDHLKCTEKNVSFSPAEFEIVEHHRFEGASNPDEEAAVYAIQSKDGKVKGTFVSAYGIYSESLSDEMLQKLQMHE
jgi:hypothetical protein